MKETLYASCPYPARGESVEIYKEDNGLFITLIRKWSTNKLLIEGCNIFGTAEEAIDWAKKG